MPTRSYLSQVELPVTAWLGETAIASSRLTVQWPDGSSQEVVVSEVDREIVITMGESSK